MRREKASREVSSAPSVCACERRRRASCETNKWEEKWEGRIITDFSEKSLTRAAESERKTATLGDSRKVL